MLTHNKKALTVGEQLRLIREKSSYSLKKVALAIGIDTSLLGKIERNERHATKEQIRILALFYKINENNLLKELLSDQIAYKIIEEKADLDILKIAEQKVEYLKTNNNVK